jgi:hypothetical protein
LEKGHQVNELTNRHNVAVTGHSRLAGTRGDLLFVKATRQFVRRMDNGSHQIAICPDFKNLSSQDYGSRRKRNNGGRWQIHSIHVVATYAFKFDEGGLPLLNITVGQEKADR